VRICVTVDAVEGLTEVGQSPGFGLQFAVDGVGIARELSEPVMLDGICPATAFSALATCSSLPRMVSLVTIPRAGPRPCSVDTRDRVKQPSGLAGEIPNMARSAPGRGVQSAPRRQAKHGSDPGRDTTSNATATCPGSPHSRWVMRHLEQIGEGDEQSPVSGRGLFTGAGPWQAWNLADPVATGCR